MTASARIVLCAPGRYANRSALQERFGSELELEFEGKDSRILRAFRDWRCPLRPTLERRDLAALEEHDCVVYAVSREFSADDAARTAHFMLKVGAELLELGAAAIKCESSGVAHGAEAWNAYSTAASEAHQESKNADESEQFTLRVRFWIALRDAFLQVPIRGDGELYSCGMHLLGEPDAAISDESALATFSDPNERESESAALLDDFCLYTLTEATLEDGETFRRSEGAPRFRARHLPCTAYDGDDLFHNPYGVLRLDQP